jgi:hypothetical protein
MCAVRRKPSVSDQDIKCQRVVAVAQGQQARSKMDGSAPAATPIGVAAATTAAATAATSGDEEMHKPFPKGQLGSNTPSKRKESSDIWPKKLVKFSARGWWVPTVDSVQQRDRPVCRAFTVSRAVSHTMSVRL